MKTLEDFVLSWLRTSRMKPPPVPYEKAGVNTGVTLYRDKRFQVQLWICPPNTDICDHCHPHIDGYAVRVAGDIKFRKHGRPAGIHDMQIVMWNNLRTPMIRVGKDELHGVTIGAAGGSFLSVTERLDGDEPVSVHLDWCGKPLDLEHEKLLRQTERAA